MLPAWRLVYALRRLWRRARVSPVATSTLGPQYVRSRDLIEIDITYLCNLSCLNCNRSVKQARDSQSMPVAMVTAFVVDSMEKGKRWRRIRVLGGEPTLHPEFHDVIDVLLGYRAFAPDCIVEVVTNGHGPKVQAALERLPDEVWVENSRKVGDVQPMFRPFSAAPIDDPSHRGADFSNGCAIIRDCGMGLSPGGYYPCAVAAGIDRVAGIGLGQSALPDEDDDMLEALQELCSLCGRFKDGHRLPDALREPLTHEVVSPTWRKLYGDYRERRRKGQRS